MEAGPSVLYVPISNSPCQRLVPQTLVVVFVYPKRACRPVELGIRFHLDLWRGNHQARFLKAFL